LLGFNESHHGLGSFANGADGLIQRNRGVDRNLEAICDDHLEERFDRKTSTAGRETIEKEFKERMM
jgi:hypothetical protein